MSAVDVLVTYDIADDVRRADVSRLLSSHGPRVQLAVFECTLTDPGALEHLLRRVRDVIDPLEDQVRVYRWAASAPASRTVLGERRLEERGDFWIV